MWGRDSLGGILGDNLGEGNCESKIASRQWGVNFCRETSICLAGPSGQGLRSWRPIKEVPKPRPGKVPKKCFGKCRSETGCRGKCRKNCLGFRLLYRGSIGDGTPSTFSALSSAPRFGPALFEALFRHFSWPGLWDFFRWLPGS